MKRQQYFLKLKMELIVVNYLVASESVYSKCCGVLWQKEFSQSLNMIPCVQLYQLAVIQL